MYFVSCSRWRPCVSNQGSGVPKRTVRGWVSRTTREILESLRNTDLFLLPKWTYPYQRSEPCNAGKLVSTPNYGFDSKLSRGLGLLISNRGTIKEFWSCEHLSRENQQRTTDALALPSQVHNFPAHKWETVNSHENLSSNYPRDISYSWLNHRSLYYFKGKEVALRRGQSHFHHPWTMERRIASRGDMHDQ